MTIYSFGQQDAVECEKTGLQRDRLIDVLQAAVTVALWLRLDWLLLSAWSDARALLRAACPKGRLRWGVLAVLALFGRLWLARRF